MDSTNNTPNDSRDDLHVFGARLKSHSGLIPGLILVAIGGLFLLDNMHVIHANSWFEYWPVVLVAIGLVQLVDSNYTGGRIAGAVLMGVGGLFLADNLGYLTFRVEDLWPLILIAVGLFMLWSRTPWGGRSANRRFWPNRRWADPSPGIDSSSFIHEVAIFSGSKRVITSQEFTGGRVSAFFGGIVLDLSGAAIAGDTARIDLAAIYGGITVRVPYTWNVETRGAGIFGGFGDRTVHPSPASGSKRLIVRGAAMFGGVNVKN